MQSLVEVAGSLWKSLQLLLHMPEAYHGSRCLFEEDHMHLGNPVNEGKELYFKFLQQLSVSQKVCSFLSALQTPQVLHISMNAR